MPANRSILSQLFSGTFAIGIARFSTIAFGLVSVIIAVRNTSAAEYGAYILILVVVSFLLGITDFGLFLTIQRFLVSSNDSEYKNTLINTVFYFRIIVILLTILIVIALKPALEHFLGRSLLLDLFVYVPFLFALGSLSSLYNSILNAKFAFTSIGIIEFATNAIELIALAILVLHFNLGLGGLFLAKLISSALSVLLAYYRAHIEHKRLFDLDRLKEMLKFGFPLQLQFVLDFIFSRIDTIMIGSILGTSGVAYYEVARKFPDSLFQLYDVFNSVYFPIIVKLYANEIREKTEKLINNSIRILAFLTVFGVLISMLFGKNILVLFFSEKYLASYLAFVLLMIGLSLKYIENLLGYSLFAIGETNKPLLVNLVRALVSLVGNLSILPLIGFVGAAAVSVISNVVAVPLDAFFLWRKEIHARLILYLKPVAVLGLLGVIYYFVGESLLLPKIVITLLYFPVCLILSCITIRDIKIVLKEARSTLERALGRKVQES